MSSKTTTRASQSERPNHSNVLDQKCVHQKPVVEDRRRKFSEFYSTNFKVVELKSDHVSNRHSGILPNTEYFSRNDYPLSSIELSSVRHRNSQDRVPRRTFVKRPKIERTLTQIFSGACPIENQEYVKSYVSRGERYVSEISRRQSHGLREAWLSKSNGSMPSKRIYHKLQQPYRSGRTRMPIERNQFRQHRRSFPNTNPSKFRATASPKLNTGSKRRNYMNDVADEKRGDSGWSFHNEETFLTKLTSDSRKTNQWQSHKRYAVAPHPMRINEPPCAAAVGRSSWRTKTSQQHEFEFQEERFNQEVRSVAPSEECALKNSSKALSCPMTKLLETTKTSDWMERVKPKNINDCYSDSCNNTSSHDAETFTKLWIHRHQPAEMENNRCLNEVTISKKCRNEKLLLVDNKKATRNVKTRRFHQQEKVCSNLISRKQNTLNPCCISDTVGQIMTFLSLLEVLKVKRVSKGWTIAADRTLKQRTIENLTVNAPFSAASGSMLLNQLHMLLPRLQCLTISIDNYRHLKGLVLSYICECKNLVFLRVENLDWHDLIIATRVILSLKTPKKGGRGHPILSNLHDLELPDSKPPVPTSTRCVRPLSSLAPNLCSLTLKSAQDPIIFSLRLFYPTVRRLFLLDTLWTTRRFAQIVSSSPQLMKFLINGKKGQMLTMVAGSGTKHITSSVISKSFPVISRMHVPGSVPVITSDERLFALVSNLKDSLYVEPLGRIIQNETGRDLTKANISMFAGFCALIGVLIIMPPMDD